METYPLGTVTFVISEDHRFEVFVSDEMVNLLTNTLADHFRAKIKEYQLEDQIAVTKVEWTRGCITIIISLGAVATVGGGFLIKEWLKDYKECSEGVRAIIEDMKNIKIWVKKKFAGKKTAVQEKAIEDKKILEVMVDNTVSMLKQIPEDQRGLVSAGVEMKVPNSQGTVNVYHVSVKREDIIQPAKTIVIEENKNKELKLPDADKKKKRRLKGL